MGGRAWLRYPPAVIGHPSSCPTGRDRFATEALARDAAVHAGLHRSTVPTTTQCQQCHGWHNQPAEN